MILGDGVMAKRIVFTAKQQLKVEEFASKVSLDAGEVRVRGICSIISTGTENIILNHLFDEGTHWDHYIKFPFCPGYSFVGEVTQCAPGVQRLKVGDRIVARSSHATEHVLSETQCHVVPPTVSSEDAAWFGLAKISFSGARAAKYVLGGRVLIIGGGPIGQLSARWALAAGAGKVVMVEPQNARLTLAKRAGVHVGINTNLLEGRSQIMDAFGGESPEYVMDTTGAAPVFSQALEICGQFGTVILLGDTGTPSRQCLNSSLLMKGLHIVGAHDIHLTEADALKVFWPLLIDGRFNLEGMVTHRFTIDQASEAYALANERRGETMGLLFDLKN
jgi:2-desacetyl-2-hydroxyethyl bacteriochlorophyllide A dehydrogenase